MEFRLTGLATLAMIATYVWTAARVAGARRTFAIKAPATSGPDGFDRVFRAHVNTLEQFAIMVPAAWLCAATVGDRWAALAVLVWIVGRVHYVISYSREAAARSTGFGITFAALLAACLASLVAIAMSYLR